MINMLKWISVKCDLKWRKCIFQNDILDDCDPRKPSRDNLMGVWDTKNNFSTISRGKNKNFQVWKLPIIAKIGQKCSK